jgi:hypothetical protein|tara:strand:- start:2780 stop:3058 length:279 start_codon:yes stop_codon:yes gene_type:complete
MYIRIVNLKFSSKIDSDAMHALAKHEMINNLPGIISIETFHVSELHSIGILKFDSKESAEKSKVVYIDNMKKNPNIRIEIFEGERSFIVEKS